MNREGGKHIVKYIGAIDDNVRNTSAVDELLSGKVVTVTETKTIGFSIKV